SATVGNPDEVLSWISGGKTLTGLVVQVPVPVTEKRFSFTMEPDPGRRMDAIARIVLGKKAIVFVGSRSEAEETMRALQGRLGHVAIHHSSLSHELRKEAESVFLTGQSACIISTSSLELGIDIGELDLVVQVGVPSTVSSFLQRMGRSGRRGRPPHVACIASDRCELLCQVAVISCARRREVEDLVPPADPVNVLVQQIFLSLVRTRRTSRFTLARELLSLSPFGHIPEKTLVRILDHLTAAGYLCTDGDMIMLGTEAEKVLGRANWRDLYSVIPGGGEMRAVTPDGEVVGRLDARFIGSRGGDAFSLGGRSWRVVKSDESREQVVVVPGAPSESRTFWTGSEIGLSPLICREVRRILVARSSGLPLSADVRECIASVADSLGEGIGEDNLPVFFRTGPEIKNPSVTVLTFQGKRFNRLLSALLLREMGGRRRITYHDFGVKITGMKSQDAPLKVKEAIDRIRTLSPGEAANHLSLPPPSLWKFGPLLPDPVFREMVLLDYYAIGPFLAVLKPMRTDVPG
ncbi:MAG: DEAD/DEAH box helicase, partial [Methanoregulaceae archaeon]|nr:DEAD/DEAH box helicase [Methanoregulaceae archaeon]